MNNIREIIKEKGLRSKWVAEQLGVAESDLSNYKSENRKVPQDKIVKLARICGVSVKDLFPEVKRKTIYKYQESDWEQ